MEKASHRKAAKEFSTMSGISGGGRKRVDYFYLFYAIYLVAVIIMHIRVRVDVADDAASRVLIAGYSLPDWVIHRYYDWSARFMEEGIGYILVQNPILWRICDAVLMAVTPLLFSYVASGKVTVYSAVILFLLFPVNILAEAGWICTTNTYLWPSVFGLIVCAALYRDYHSSKQNHRFPFWFIYFIALINAADHELLAAYLFLILAAYLIAYRKRYNRLSRTGVVGLIFVFLNILFILLSPGNRNRLSSETANWFPAFAQFGIIDKGILGALKTYRVLIGDNNLLFVALCSMVMINGVLFLESPVKKLISAIPLFGLVFRNTYYSNMVIGDVYELHYAAPQTVRPLAILAVVMVSLLLAFFWIFSDGKNWQDSLIPIAVLIGGIATTAAMGLSPTIYASGNRTTAFLHFGIIYLALRLILNVTVHEKSEGKILTESVKVFLAVVLTAFCVLFCALNLNNLVQVMP